MVDKILEICKVRPPIESPNIDVCLPLTIFDLAWLRTPPAEILLFYESRSSELVFSSSVLPKLKHALSLTLRYFVPVVGNLVWPSSSHNPFIRYKEGDGVLLTASLSGADFYYLSGKSIRECNNIFPFIARLVGPRCQVPTVAVKITLFPDKGFCLSTTFHHGVFDGKSIALFMKSWASMSKFGENDKGLDPELVPSFDRKLVREQYSDIEDSYIEFLKQNEVTQNKLSVGKYELPADTVRGTFELSGLDVKRLKELASSRLPNYKGSKVSQVPYVSTFAVIYAYMLYCFVIAKESTINKLVVMFPFDCRDLIRPPLPANYFGVCIGRFVTYLEKEELLGVDNQILFLNLITKIKKGLDDRGVTGAKEWLSSHFDASLHTNTTKVYVAGSPRFGYENMDFGWGNPSKLYGANDGSGGVHFTNVDGGGVEIELCLSSHEMEIFASAFAQGLKTIVNSRSAAL